MNTITLMGATLMLAALALVSACGSDDPARPTDLASGTVTVTLGGGDGPGPGFHVLLQDPDGMVKEMAITDDSGQAVLEVMAGDMVTTAHEPTPGSFRLQTIVGVRPNDRYNLAPEGEGLSDPTHVVITEGEDPQPRDVLIFGSGCSSGTTTAGFPHTSYQDDNCRSNSGLLNLCWESLLDSERQAFAYVTDVPFDPSDTTRVDLTGLWRTDWQEITLTLPPLPADFRSLRLVSRPERDGGSFSNLVTLNLNQGDDIPVTQTLKAARGFAEAIEVWASVTGEAQENYLAERFLVDESTSALAFGFAAPTVTAEPVQFTVAHRPDLDWSYQPSNLAADGIILHVWWSDGSDEYYWKVYLPPQTTTFRFPELPAALVSYRLPAPTVENELRMGLVYVGSTVLDGYDGMRANLSLEGNLPDPRNEPDQVYETWTDLLESPSSKLGRTPRGDHRTSAIFCTRASPPASSRAR